MAGNVESNANPGFLEASRRTILDGHTYRNIAYLLLAAPLGLVYSTGLVFGFVFGIALTIVLVGVPIVLGTVLLCRVAIAFERSLANSLLPVTIEAPGDVPHIGDATVVEFVTSTVTAPSTWKGIGFLVVKSFLGFLVFLYVLIVGILTVGFLLAPVGGEITVMEVWTIDTTIESILVVPLGVLIAVVSVLLLNAGAVLTGTIAVSLLGASDRD